MKQPVIKRERIILRPFDQGDARQVQFLAGAKEISDMTARIPHPYPDGEAESWISSHRTQWENRTLAAFAITLNEGNQLAGAISLTGIEDAEAELGYWIGIDFWGNGYATEACSAIAKFGFDQLALKRINAHHLTRNKASGQVLMKNGFIHNLSKKDQYGFMKQPEMMEFYSLSAP